MANTKFVWDFDVPEGPFWADLEMTVARNFLTCFTPEEQQAMTFDGTLPKDEKLELLLARSHAKMAQESAAAAPKPLWEADFQKWANLQLSLYTMNLNLDRLDACEAVLREWADRGTTDIARAVTRNMLSTVKEKQGHYAEAEALARGVLPWMQTHERLGVDSPQAFGTTRSIIRAVWKQGRYAEAEVLVDDYDRLVDNMGDSKFVKYQDDERRYLAELMEQLRAWRDEQAPAGAAKTATV